jgi:hypothetical protein
MEKQTLIGFLSKRAEKIEEMRADLFELQFGLEGAEIEHKGQEALIMHVDWNTRQVYLNYDDVNFEWVDF